MKIEGIGNVNKKTMVKELGLGRDKEGREALKNGEFTAEEIAGMYKLQKVREACKIGSCGDTFRANYSRIPDSLKEKLSPQELAELTEAFYKCYGDGKNA